MAVLAVLYLYVLPKASAKRDEPVTVAEKPGGPGSSGPVHPLQKYLEITGVRFAESGKGQVKVHYVVINHSPADLPDLQAQVTVTANAKPVFEFPANIPSIGPFESKDMETTVNTNLQPYELPDWQIAKATMRITSAP